MNIGDILQQLKAERNRLSSAIAALGALDGSKAPRRAEPTSQTTSRRRRHRMSAAGRKRISETMKARWAARRKEAKRNSKVR
jgi:hypothetical protein